MSSAVELLFSGTDGIEWIPVYTEPSDLCPVVAPSCTETIGSLMFVDFDVSREDGFNSTCRDVTLRGLPLLVNEDVFSGCEDVSFTAYITLFAWFATGGADLKDRREDNCFFCCKPKWVLDIANSLDSTALFCRVFDISCINERREVWICFSWVELKAVGTDFIESRES